jgi:hypothetical protein
MAAVAASAMTAGLIATSAGSAAAAPQPSVTQVQHKVSELETKAAKLGQQYIQVQQELASANARLKLVNEQIARYTVQFDKLRTEVGRIAVTSYEDGNLNSAMGLLTSGRPQQILDQASILSELTSADAAEMREFLAAAKQLSNTQQAGRSRRCATACASASRRSTRCCRRRRPCLPSSRRRRSRASVQAAGAVPVASTTGLPGPRPKRRLHTPTPRSAARTCGAAPARATPVSTAQG